MRLQSSDGKEEIKEVKVGLSTSSMVEITSGLQEGDTVVFNALETTAKASTSNMQQQQWQQRQSGGGMMGGSGGRTGGPPPGAGGF